MTQTPLLPPAPADSDAAPTLPCPPPLVALLVELVRYEGDVYLPIPRRAHATAWTPTARPGTP